jgi:NAD(P)-dependent dehydrogenase (short-subunit alcohol dehydrogenase family)
MRVLIIGATGIIGQAVATALESRHEVLRAARTSAELAVDIMQPESIDQLFRAIGAVDAVVCTAPAGDSQPFGPIDSLTSDLCEAGLARKTLSQANLARVAATYLRDRGSITLTSGVTGRQPIVGATSASMVNGAIEGFVRAAALEMPRGIRINAVSPQWTIPFLEHLGMDPALGVPPAEVARGYVESVEGELTGTVIDAGWRHDPAVGSASVAAP